MRINYVIAAMIIGQKVFIAVTVFKKRARMLNTYCSLRSPSHINDQ